MEYRTNKEVNCIQNKISYICQNEYQCFLSKENVEGVGLGYKIIKGCNTFEECISIFVRKKENEVKLNCKDLLPKTYKGIKTDIKEIGEITTEGLKTKVRPVVQGYSVGVSPYSERTTTSGTTGCLVTDGINNYLLSNNHILSQYGDVPIQNPILQPSKGDGGVKDVDNVGILSRYMPLRFISPFKSPINYVDCAIAEVTPKSIAIPKIEMVGIPNAIIQPTLNADVMKVGRTTSLTTGVVTDIKATVKITCGGIGKRCLMKNQIITSKMTTLGDSGAALVDENRNVMGGSDNISMHNEISKVLETLKVTIVTN